MRMFCTSVNVEASKKLSSQSVFRQHATNCVFDEALRMFRTDHSRGMLALSSGITGVLEDHTIRPFFSGHSHLLGVDNNHVVATIYMRRVAWLVFATNNFCNLTRHTAQNLGVCVYNNPALLYSGLGSVSR